jgi:hypothetical protein
MERWTVYILRRKLAQNVVVFTQTDAAKLQLSWQWRILRNTVRNTQTHRLPQTKAFLVLLTVSRCSCTLHWRRTPAEPTASSRHRPPCRSVRLLPAKESTTAPL